VNIPFLPDSVSHRAWTDFLESVGIGTRGEVVHISTTNGARRGRPGLIVTTAAGDEILVPFEEAK
jgi:hypothetical protein